MNCMHVEACLVVVRRDAAGSDEDWRAKPAHDATSHWTSLFDDNNGSLLGTLCMCTLTVQVMQQGLLAAGRMSATTACSAHEGLAAEQRRGQGHEQQAHALVHHDAQVQQQVAGLSLRPLLHRVRQRIRDACGALWTCSRVLHKAAAATEHVYQRTQFVSSFFWQRRSSASASASASVSTCACSTSRRQAGWQAAGCFCGCVPEPVMVALSQHVCL